MGHTRSYGNSGNSGVNNNSNTRPDPKQDQHKNKFIPDKSPQRRRHKGGRRQAYR